MPSDPFVRNERVQVRVSTTGHAWVRATVLVDLGGETLIVGRKNPSSTKRVPRESVKSEERSVIPTSKVERRTTGKRKRDVDTSKLYCAEGPNGLCVLQRQSSPPRKAEMVDGTWSLCGEWLTSRSAPKKTGPTCPTCVTRVEQQNWSKR